MKVNKKWLLLDTAGQRGVVGISEGNKILAEIFLTDQKSHAEQLSAAISTCLSSTQLTLTDIEGIAVGKGPGSFVGTRVALAHAKGIAIARNIPLVGVGTLAAIGGSEELPFGIGLVVTDARRNELFIQKIRRRRAGTTCLIEKIEGPLALSCGQFEDQLTGLDFIVGNGFTDLPAKSLLVTESKGPSAHGILVALLSQNTEAGLVNEVYSLAPEYCRSPDAQPNLKFLAKGIPLP